MIQLPSLFWFKEIRDYAAKLVPFFQTAIALTAWFYNIVWVLVVGAFQKITALITGVDLSQFGNASLSAWQYIGIVNAMFPLTETCALLSLYYTLWFTVIAVRWIKSFIPTLAN